MIAPSDVLSVYEFQRLVFIKAVEFEWPGRHPLTLGDDQANRAFRDALGFLKSLERSETMREAFRDRGAPPGSSGI